MCGNVSYKSDGIHDCPDSIFTNLQLRSWEADLTLNALESMVLMLDLQQQSVP